jgi:hypothetical protein
MTKLCPLRPIRDMTENKGPINFGKCIGNECEWFEQFDDRCGIKSIQKKLEVLERAVNSLNKY